MRRRYIEETEDVAEEYGAIYDTADGIEEDQFTDSRTRIPIKSILYIFGFFIAGTICFAISILIAIGYIDDKYNDRIWPLFILGSILMIPGGYYGYILFCVIFKLSNYTIDDIPVL